MLNKLTTKYFEWGEKLGKGGFGTVFQAYSKVLKMQVAVKIVQKNTISMNEVQLMQKLKHKNIVKLFQIIEIEDYVYIVMELIQGGNLKEMVNKLQEGQLAISEENIAKMINGILQGLSYLHKLGIVHRDIKPGNLVLKKKNDFGSVTILDFGVSEQYSNTISFKGFECKYGTLLYSAPEVISHKTHYKAVDLWSVGMTAYQFLNKGAHPFGFGMTKEELINYISIPEIEYNDNFSRLSINFLSRLLQVSPSSRYTTEEAVQHPWISGKFEKIPQTMNEKLVTVVAKETLVAVMRAMFSIAFNSNERPKVQYINKVERVYQDIHSWYLMKKKNNKGTEALDTAPDPVDVPVLNLVKQPTLPFSDNSIDLDILLPELLGELTTRSSKQKKIPTNPGTPRGRNNSFRIKTTKKLNKPKNVSKSPRDSILKEKVRKVSSMEDGDSSPKYGEIAESETSTNRPKPILNKQSKYKQNMSINKPKHMNTEELPSVISPSHQVTKHFILQRKIKHSMTQKNLLETKLLKIITKEERKEVKINLAKDLKPKSICSIKQGYVLSPQIHDSNSLSIKGKALTERNSISSLAFKDLKSKKTLGSRNLLKKLPTYHN